MGGWSFSLELDADDDVAVFVRIARAISADIARGRLQPGERLPGTRSLARSLGVNRNTVVAAYEELEAEGWVETGRARGTFVSERMPLDRPRGFSRCAAPRQAVPERTGFPMGAERLAGPMFEPDPDVLDVGGGMPDPRLVPGELIARAYRRVVSRHATSLLDYGPPNGHQPLRSALGEMLSSTRGVAAAEDDILITRGSQMALWLVFSALVREGDRVVVESFGYPPAWAAIRQSGAELCPIPVDERGARIDALERVLEDGPIRAVYLTPHHQYPTTAVLAAERRLALLELARRHRFAIIEDDYDNEFHYEGRPVLPLASVDTSGVVVYVGTLSKVLAPGIRLGWIVAPRSLLRRLAALRTHIDRQGDQVVEAAVAELMEDGEIQRHVWRMKRIYHARRDHLARCLEEQLGEVLEFNAPRGGMALWARAAPRIDVDAWQRATLARGVHFSTARTYAFDGRPRPYVRLGFARLEEEQITRAVETMRVTLRHNGVRT